MRVSVNAAVTESLRFDFVFLAVAADLSTAGPTSIGTIDCSIAELLIWLLHRPRLRLLLALVFPLWRGGRIGLLRLDRLLFS